MMSQLRITQLPSSSEPSSLLRCAPFPLNNSPQQTTCPAPPTCSSMALLELAKRPPFLHLAKELYGPELIKTRVLELNASDERGISIVREKVKDFARMQLSNPSAEYRNPISVSSVQDHHTGRGGFNGRRMPRVRCGERWRLTARLLGSVLICNYVTRIIDPLASRCSKFRFKSLDQDNAKKRVEDIAEKEGVKLEDGASDALIKCSEGDLRKAITFLQSSARLVGAVKTKEEEEEDAMDVDQDTKVVTVKIVEDIAGVIPDKTIDGLVKAMQPRSKGLVYEDVAKVVTDMIADGWSATQVVTQVCIPPLSSCHSNHDQLYQSIIYNEAIPDSQKNKIVLLFSESDKRLVDGSDEHLTILDLALRTSNVMAGA